MLLNPQHSPLVSDSLLGSQACDPWHLATTAHATAHRVHAHAHSHTCIRSLLYALRVCHSTMYLVRVHTYNVRTSTMYQVHST